MAEPTVERREALDVELVLLALFIAQSQNLRIAGAPDDEAGVDDDLALGAIGQLERV
jgi:hypothetical protein